MEHISAISVTTYKDYGQNKTTDMKTAEEKPSIQINKYIMDDSLLRDYIVYSEECANMEYIWKIECLKGFINIGFMADIKARAAIAYMKRDESIKAIIDKYYALNPNAERLTSDMLQKLGYGVRMKMDII